MSSIRITVDARGLPCPAPLLKARQALLKVAIGERIEVLASDSTSVRDFHRLAELSRHQLIEFEALAKSYRYILEKG